ncbi:MAG TPA: extracellular solute-binding protein [Candidatus Nanopelagicaceae bacterium]
MKHSTKWGPAVALVASVALLVSGSSSASSSAATASPAAVTPVTITFWHSYSEAGSEVQTITDNLIPRFEAEHPGITVKQVAIPYDSLHQKLLTAAAGGDLPDVVRLDLSWVAELANLGVLSKLNTEMSDFTKYSKLVFPGTLASNYFKGSYYGLPLDTNTRIMFWNKAAFAKAKISKAPATFAELVADAPKLKKVGIYVFGESGTGGWNTLPWIWSGGGDITDAKFTKSTGYLNSAKNIATVQMLVNMYKKGYIPNLITGNKSALGTSDGLAKGKYASILDGPWMVPVMKGMYPNFKLAMAPVPAGPGGSVSVVGGEDVAMMSTTTQKAASLELIRYMLSPDWQLSMAKVGQMPVRKDLNAVLPSVQSYYKLFAQQLLTAKPRIPSPNWTKIDQIVNDQMQRALNGSMTVKAALTAAAKAIDPLLVA